MGKYLYKTRPFNHQHEEFIHHGKDSSRGLLWEQGCGKTKPVIDTVAYLYETGEVDALLVIAPNGVHRNWVSDEIPAHMPDRVQEKTVCHIWYSTGTKRHMKSYQDCLNHRGLAVLVMSYDAIMTKAGQKAWKQFLTKRRCLYVLDESQRIKTPGAKRTKRILGSREAAQYRRILSGTPVANTPFDVYSQLKFLEPTVWLKYGISSFAAFKSYFGVWETWETKDERQYPKCVAYRNLEILAQETARLGSRVTKDQVLDLPPKLYSKRYFELTKTQADLYNQVRDEYLLDLETGQLTIMLAIVRLLRAQQVVCGYFPTSDDNPTLRHIPGANPRVDLLGEICDDLPHSAIIWCRFREDVQLVAQKLGKRCVVVDGSVPSQKRGPLLDAFQKREIQFMVANPACIGTGVTLTAARTVVYYSNSFNYEHRSQSEDRAHRIGQEHPVNYVDIVAMLPDAQGVLSDKKDGRFLSGGETIDSRIIESLRKKSDVASLITGDNMREWI